MNNLKKIFNNHEVQTSTILKSMGVKEIEPNVFKVSPKKEYTCIIKDRSDKGQDFETTITAKSKENAVELLQKEFDMPFGVLWSNTQELIK